MRRRDEHAKHLHEPHARPAIQTQLVGSLQRGDAEARRASENAVGGLDVVVDELRQRVRMALKSDEHSLERGKQEPDVHRIELCDGLREGAKGADGSASGG